MYFHLGGGDEKQVINLEWPKRLTATRLRFCESSEDSDNSFDLDQLLSRALDEYESQSGSGPASETPNPAPTTSPTPQSRFAPPKTAKDVQEARRQGVPKKTQQDTYYCVRVWNEWRSYRRETCGDTGPALSDIIPSDLQHWLNYFVLEVRKNDGSEYPPDSLHHLYSGIVRFLRANNCPSIDIFKDSDITEFRATLDAEMKRLQALGVGSKKKQAEPLAEEEEEVLWQKGLLGDHTP